MMGKAMHLRHWTYYRLLDLGGRIRVTFARRFLNKYLRNMEEDY